MSAAFLNVGMAASKSIPEVEPDYDIRVLVDISGSMKRTDPQNLRQPAVRLLSEMIPQGSAAGIWTFGRFVNMLVPLKMVDQQWRDDVMRANTKINSIGLYTNIPEALERASFGWDKPPGKTKRNMILLTDGKVDLAKDPAVNARARQDVLNRLIPRLRDAKVSVHTIALSDNVDAELLKALSYQTDGRFQNVQNQEDLMRVFVDAFDASVPSQQVPLSKDNLFPIDDDVKEFTVLVYKASESESVALQDPFGTKYSAASHPSHVRWFEDKQLDVVTVTAPVAGQWQLLAKTDPANRVTVISDLKLDVTELPNTVFTGDALSVDISMQAKEGIIKNSDFLRLIDLIFSQHYLDANKVWAGKLTSFSDKSVKIPVDGIYHARLQKSLLPGIHEVTVKVEGRTFTRQMTQKINVLASAVKTWIDAPKSAKKPFTVLMEPESAVTTTDLLRVRAKAQGPAKTIVDVTMEVNQQGSGWKGNFDAFDGPGTYRVIFQVKGKTLTGHSVNEKIGPLESATSTLAGAPLMAGEKPDDDNQYPGTVLPAAASDVKTALETEATVVTMGDGAFIQENTQLNKMDDPTAIDMDALEQDEDIPEDEDLDSYSDEEDALSMDDASLDDAEAAAVVPAEAENKERYTAIAKIGLAGGFFVVNGLLVLGGYLIYRKATSRQSDLISQEEKELEGVEVPADVDSFSIEDHAEDQVLAAIPTLEDSFEKGRPDIMDGDDDQDVALDLSNIKT